MTADEKAPTVGHGLDRGEVMWHPSQSVVAASRLTALMRAHGIATFQELHRRSVSDPDWFWDAAVKDLGVDFYQPYQQVRDTSRGLPWTTWWTGGQLNIVHSCLDRYAGTPTDLKTALVWEGEAGEVRTSTYAELRESVDDLAAGMRQLGIAVGDRVGVFMPMIPEVAVAVLACAKLGAVLVPAFSGYGPDALGGRLRDCGARMLICADGFSRRGRTVDMKSVADAAADECPEVTVVITVPHAGLASTRSSDRDHRWADVLAAGRAAPVATEKLDPEATLMVIYTSGTTGTPKGAVHTHGGFPIKGLSDMAYGFDVGPDDVVFWFTDIGWMMGAWLIYGALIAGATMVMYEGTPDTPTADRLWQLIEAHRVTVFGLSPTLVRSLMTADTPGPRAHDLSSLRVIGATGELWDTPSWMWCFQEVCRGEIPLINYAGGTELSGGILCGNVLTPLRPKSFSAPMLGMDADIVDERGAPVLNAVGELVVRSATPGMTRGFWHDDERYLDTYWSRFPDLWVHGDWGYIDETDGLWYLLGRSDDTIKVAGKRVGPGEVETVLNSHPGVLASAAVGIADPVKGERLVCFVVPRSPDSDEIAQLPAEVADLVARALGRPLRPSVVHVVAELPRTRNAKIVRKAIRLAYVGALDLDSSSIENPLSLEAIQKSGQGRVGR
ncbi:MAG: acetyl-CoA synthetase [Blastococcus sp.]|jgi:acetyl-CoA synthetase|nr:acetyl-CoA synthetase [Blastococcus sp.]